MTMRKALLTLAALTLALVAAPTALADPGNDKAPKLTTVKLLGFNDLHGHLEANTPGTIAVACCTAAGAAISVPAGGAEYFATHLKALGSEDPDTYVLGAGDMIGGSPLISGLFHDEPAIEFMNYVGVDTVGVGNHEFDEGPLELLRMQYGGHTHEGGGENTGSSYTPFRADGCHPVDGCQDGTPFSGSVFQYLAANVIDDDTDNPLLPAYSIVNTSVGEKIAFIGETLQGTPEIVTPSGVAGLTFLDEADTVNMLVPRLQQRGVQTIVLLLHQGGFQNAPFSRGYQEVDACENFTGPELLDVVNRLHPAVDVVLSAHTHAPYICTINGKLVTSASSFGRVISKIDLTIDRRTGDVVSKTADNVVVTQTVAKDAGATAILQHYKTFSDPIANRVVAEITADIRSSRSPGGFTSFSGEQEMGNLIADAQREATRIEHHGGSRFAFMNPGGVRAHLLYNQISGNELPGEVTYGELFAVQPFGNSLVVKTCTGQQIYNVLAQQFTGRTSPLILLVSQEMTYQYYRTPPAGQPNVVDGSVKIDGVAIGKAASYRVTMNSFLADGGDGFPAFRTCTEPLGGEVDVDALGRYMAERSPVSPPALTRIERLN
jgi:5'-nucleotidase